MPIKLFSASSDNHFIYYTIEKRSTDRQDRTDDGYVYEWGEDTFQILIDPDFAKLKSEELWRMNIQTGLKEHIVSVPAGNLSGSLSGIPLIESFEVSENGAYLLLSVSRFGNVEIGEFPFTREAAVFGLTEGKWIVPIGSMPAGMSPAWISDHEFAYGHDSTTVTTLHIFDVSSRQERQLNSWPKDLALYKLMWDKENHSLYALSMELFKIDIKNDRTEKIEMSWLNVMTYSFDQRFRKLAFVSETSNIPPEVSLYDLKTSTTTRLTKINPQLETIARGYVEEIKEKTADGRPIDGYLVHPVNEQPGTLYPIIIATYNFSGRYIADAEWHSSFPAQTLAAEGYLVFLLNKPGMSQAVSGTPEELQAVEFGSIVPVFEGAVEFLKTKGGDTSKVGVYGWSHGAFVVNYLTTHSDKFHAASIGEGGDFNPSNFWLHGSETWQKIYKNLFGGPPWGSTLQAYIDYAPFFKLDKMHTPLLMEYATSGSLQGLEMYSSLRYSGIPAELVVYDHEEHNFVKPKARIASMGRKVDWFNYWLLNKQDPHPEKQEQYSRWNKMKDVFEAKHLARKEDHLDASETKEIYEAVAHLEKMVPSPLLSDSEEME